MKKIFLFFMMFLSLSVVKAEHLDLVPIDGVYSSQYNMDNGSYFSSNQKKYYMDGKIVYCVEPGVGIYTNDFYGVDDLYSSLISADIIDKISLIGYFGYDYPGHNTDNYFLASQELIWELLGNNEIHFTTGINDTGDIINIDYEKNEIMSLVNSYYIKPSFDGSSVSGIYGDEIVLIDQNNVLSNYSVLGNGYIDGNKLVVKLDDLGSNDITLIKNKYDNMSSIFYRDDISQDFMFLRAGDVISNVSVSSYIPMNQVSIDKKGLMLENFDDGKFIYEERGLDGVTFGLYSSHDISVSDYSFSRDELVSTLVTVDGFASSSLIPNGDYYLKEISTNDDFVLDDSVYDIHLENSDREAFTYMVDLKNDRKKIFINLQKHGEVFDGVDSNGGSYVDVPLSGIKFGLYSGSDIYNVDGDLLVSKDSMIRDFVTDSEGIINEEVDIPFGTYYFKELETLPGYKIDPNIYEFSVSSGVDDSIKIMVTREPIVNEMIKSRLVIRKIDSLGNPLEGASFKVFDSFNNFIYEGTTDSNGIISIDNLAYGKYHFYEVSAPDGYYLSSKIYEINVSSDDDLIEVSVMNQRMPITSDIYALPNKLSTIGLGFGLLTLSLGVIVENRKESQFSYYFFLFIIFCFY